MQNSYLSEKAPDRWLFVVRTEKVRLFLYFGLTLQDEGISFRGIAASTGNSRQKITEIINLAERKGLVCPLDEEMTNEWIEEFLFPEKSLEASGRQPLDFDYIHKELAKPNVTLSLLHYEYEADCRANNKIP